MTFIIRGISTVMIVGKPILVEPGAPAPFDVEYQRNGVRDLMMISKPARGWREVLITERRTKIDFAHAMKHLVAPFPVAKSIRVVLDNLNTHKPASLYDVFPADEARAIAKKLAFQITAVMRAGCRQAAVPSS